MKHRISCLQIADHQPCGSLPCSDQGPQVAWRTHHGTVLLARPWHGEKLFTIDVRPILPGPRARGHTATSAKPTSARYFDYDDHRGHVHGVR